MNWGSFSQRALNTKKAITFLGKKLKKGLYRVSMVVLTHGAINMVLNGSIKLLIRLIKA